MNIITIASSTERFIITLFAATLVHSSAFSLVGFVLPESNRPPNTTMEVILVQKSTKNIPDQAEYLAQVDHEGGGSEDEREKARPTTPTIAPFPDQTAELVATPPPKQVAAATQTAQVKKLTTQRSVIQHVSSQNNVMPVTNSANQQSVDDKTQLLEDTVPASTLIMNSLAAISSIQPELDEKFNAFTNRKREKFVNPSTREYQYAAYQSAWRQKIERVGARHFPKQASRDKISGRLMVDVAINANGTIQQITIKKSSGHKILDEAALRIAHRAAPFSLFSEEMRQEGYDILHITCWWNFGYGNLTTN